MNPNEYNDDAFLKASNEFQGDGVRIFESLWEAGAAPEDIIGEINNALAEAGVSSRSGDGPLTLVEETWSHQ